MRGNHCERTSNHAFYWYLAYCRRDMRQPASRSHRPKGSASSNELPAHSSRIGVLNWRSSSLARSTAESSAACADFFPLKACSSSS